MEQYDLEFDKLARIIEEENAISAIIQLPDGLKPRAQEISRFIKKRFGKEFNLIFWAGSCFGACDIPLQANSLGPDILVQFGHSEWR